MTTERQVILGIEYTNSRIYYTDVTDFFTNEQRAVDRQLSDRYRVQVFVVRGADCTPHHTTYLQQLRQSYIHRWGGVPTLNAGLLWNDADTLTTTEHYCALVQDTQTGHSQSLATTIYDLNLAQVSQMLDVSIWHSPHGTLQRALQQHGGLNRLAVFSRIASLRTTPQPFPQGTSAYLFSQIMLQVTRRGGHILGQINPEIKTKIFTFSDTQQHIEFPFTPTAEVLGVPVWLNLNDPRVHELRVAYPGVWNNHRQLIEWLAKKYQQDSAFRQLLLTHPTTQQIFIENTTQVSQKRAKEIILSLHRFNMQVFVDLFIDLKDQQSSILHDLLKRVNVDFYSTCFTIDPDGETVKIARRIQTAYEIDK